MGHDYVYYDDHLIDGRKIVYLHFGDCLGDLVTIEKFGSLYVPP